jgi:TPR repeat protein
MLGAGLKGKEAKPLSLMAQIIPGSTQSLIPIIPTEFWKRMAIPGNGKINPSQVVGKIGGIIGNILEDMRGVKTFKKAKDILNAIYNGSKETEFLEVLYDSYFALIRTSAYQGNVEAQFELGQFYEMPTLIQTQNKYFNPRRSKYWYKKACENSNGDACLALANYYATCKDSSVSMELELLLKSFNLGNNTAADNLALLYIKEGNFKEALRWLKKSIEVLPDNGDTLFELGKLYYNGLGVRKSYKQAHALFSNAIKSGYITQYAKEEALFYIGKMYFYGQYVERSKEKAKYLFEKANVDNDHEDIVAFCEQNAKVLKMVKKEKVIIS